MPNRPILCGKCGTSMIHIHVVVATGLMQVTCRDCGHSVSSDSLPAALAKFEEKLKP